MGHALWTTQFASAPGIIGRQITLNDRPIAIRTTPSSSAAAAALQRELSAIDPAIPIFDAAPLGDLLALQTATSRFGTTLLGAFSVVSLLLASIGIYGVLAFVIGLSRREIAIRMALGATRSGVIGLIVRQGMTLVALGLAAGLVVAAFATEARPRSFSA